MDIYFGASVGVSIGLFIISYATTYGGQSYLWTVAAICGLATAIVSTYLSMVSCDLARGGAGSVDVGTISTVILASLPFFLITQSRAETLTGGAAVATAISLGAGLAFVLSTAMWAMFVAFEALLLSAIYLLLLTSKSERARDAALEMFVWTLVGSVGLLTGFGLLGGEAHGSSLPERWGLAPTICFVLGFGVKVPLWPTTAWLLKAHVEASVEFSILLSGFIVKIGVLGLHRTLWAADEPQAGLFAASLATIGLFDAASRLPAQRDIKRIVALTTVIEMNWAVLALGLGGAQQVSIAGYLCLAHCLTTTTEFFLVEAVTKRFGTRDIAFIGGLALAAPQLWLLSVGAVLITIGFPGTSLFWAKYMFFTSLLSALPGLAIALGLLFLVALPVFFIRLWSLIWFGARGGSARIYDVTSREALILGLSMGGGALLGVCPGAILWAFTPAAL
jgi:NADH-quinone oxidoreductase subunit M